MHASRFLPAVRSVSLNSYRIAINAATSSLLPRRAGCPPISPSQTRPRLYATTTSPAALQRNNALKDKLKEDLKSAMRNKEKIKLNVVKSLISDVSYAEKSENPPENLITVVQKALKRRQDSVEEYKKGGRPELAEVEEQEMAVISAYLPKQMSLEDLEKLVREVAASISAAAPSDLGKLIKEVGNRVDPAEAPRKLVSDIAKKILAK